MMDSTVCTKRQLRFQLPCKDKTPIETEESTSEYCQMSPQQHNSQQKGKYVCKTRQRTVILSHPLLGPKEASNREFG